MTVIVLKASVRYSSLDGLENVQIGLEATSHYSSGSAYFLLKKRLRVYIFNPL
jgi:transposase